MNRVDLLGQEEVWKDSLGQLLKIEEDMTDDHARHLMAWLLWKADWLQFRAHYSFACSAGGSHGDAAADALDAISATFEVPPEQWIREQPLFEALVRKLTPPVKAYKLLRIRKDDTLGPLFINRRQRIPLDTWLPAEDHPTPGYAHRPGWHCTRLPIAPHLSMQGRQWFIVHLRDVTVHHRPEAQGGEWLLAESMKVIGPVLVPRDVSWVGSGMDEQALYDNGIRG